MHDNPPALPGTPFAPLDHRVVEMRGRDAVAFAQAQFMNDVGALADRQWQWNGWLTPKGRVIALFALLRLDAETLWLLLPDADPAAFGEGLRRFVFRSKVAITVRDELRVSGRFEAAEQAHGNAFAIAEGGTLELDFGGDGGPRCLRIAPTSFAEDAGGSARWAAFDLEHGLPRLPASQIEQWTPQQLSLERLRAFSVKKGCYPGQEIVARTHFLGKAKRGLGLLEADAAIAPGAQVHGDDAVLGTVVASAGTSQRHVALAVLPLEREFTALRIGAIATRESALRGGLAR